MLLNAGADEKMKDGYGRTPRHIAESNVNATMAAVFKNWDIYIYI